MFVYQCMRCGYKMELALKRTVPFRSPHEDKRKVIEGIAPPRCNDMFQRVWTIPNLNGLETRRRDDTS